jgi:hypothetical protein
MRSKFYSIFYLLIILFYLLRPSLPYIEYVLNKEYIEKNLCVEKSNPDNCCHGKCYLQEQINKQEEPQDNTNKGSNKIVPDNRMDDHIKEVPAYPVLYNGVNVLSDYYYTPGITRFVSSIFIPPEF